VIRLGIVGLSEGNGHPFSFSAIVNGYERSAFAAAGLPVILDYLERQPKERFGFPDARVTHAWTQDPILTARLAAACRIPHALDRLDQMVDAVDAVLLARDDWERHGEMALPFLERGTPVFVDKPLTLDIDTLERFRPHLEAGRLMSTSGLRYAGELEVLRSRLPSLGTLRLVQAVVVNRLDKYGVHLLDAVAGLGLPAPIAVARVPAPHEAVALTLADGATMTLHCLGEAAPTFRLSLFGTRGHAHVDLHDNFTAFRNTLGRFLQMVRDGRPPIAPEEVLRTMALIRTAGTLAPGRSLHLDDVTTVPVSAA
jgi:predicted dehydrogenase